MYFQFKELKVFGLKKKKRKKTPDCFKEVEGKKKGVRGSFFGGHF